MRITRSITAGIVALVVAGTTAAAAPADATPLATKHTVTIVAKMTAPATVTSSGNGIVQQKERTGTWTRTFTKKRFTYYSVTTSIFSDDDDARVTCKIKVDGKTIRNKSASGSYASVDCSYSTN